MENKKERLYCPNCGSENPYSSENCFCCGYDLKQVKAEIEQAEERRKEALKNEHAKTVEKAATKRKSLKIFILPVSLIAACVIIFLVGSGLRKSREEVSSTVDSATEESAASLFESAIEAIEATPPVYESAKSESMTDESLNAVNMEVSSIDYAAYPEMLVNLYVQSIAGEAVSNINESAIKVQCNEDVLTVSSVKNELFGDYSVSLRASDTATAKDLMNVQSINISIDGVGGECSFSFIPGKEMMTRMLEDFHDAYIEDINAHSLNRMLDFMDTDVDYDDHAALINQMRTEVTGGFLNSIAQSLQNCQVTDVFAEDENTFHVNVTLQIDGVYEEPYAVWKNESASIASAITEFLGSVSDDTNIRLYSYVTEYCEYLVRKTTDGSYKIYCYTGDISLAKNWQVYNAMVVS